MLIGVVVADGDGVGRLVTCAGVNQVNVYKGELKLLLSNAEKTLIMIPW